MESIRRFAPIVILGVMVSWGCGLKTEYLPLPGAPHVAGVEFLREVRADGHDVQKTHFPHNRITSPFFFLIKIKDLENSGAVVMRFYKPGKNPMTPDAPLAELQTSRTFQYGEAGKYYEFVLFFDQVRELPPGQYRYAVFLDHRLLLENDMIISPPEPAH